MLKTVILAGGLGTRLSEETALRPKPMIEIGTRPILWHIMQHYAGSGFREFYIASGYRAEMIKHYFLDYALTSGHLTVNLRSGRTVKHGKRPEDWTVHVVDTGEGTNTGGRLKRLQPWLKKEPFLLSYGDGVSNVDLKALVRFHRKCGRLATVTAVRPPARFGGVSFEGDLVKEFIEKPQIGEGWINGGFMVMQPEVLDLITGDASSLEAELLAHLAQERQLAAYRHDGFWQCMDTLRDKRLLESLWVGGHAPWIAPSVHKG